MKLGLILTVLLSGVTLGPIAGAVDDPVSHSCSKCVAEPESAFAADAFLSIIRINSSKIADGTCVPTGAGCGAETRCSFMVEKKGEFGPFDVGATVLEQAYSYPPPGVQLGRSREEYPPGEPGIVYVVSTEETVLCGSYLKITVTILREAGLPNLTAIAFQTCNDCNLIPSGD